MRQAFHRTSTDGLFPKMKHYEEIQADDVEKLVKNKHFDFLKKVIQRKNVDDKLTHALISQFHDKDGQIIE